MNGNRTRNREAWAPPAYSSTPRTEVFDGVPECVSGRSMTRTENGGGASGVVTTGCGKARVSPNGRAPAASATTALKATANLVAASAVEGLMREAGSEGQLSSQAGLPRVGSGRSGVVLCPQRSPHQRPVGLGRTQARGGLKPTRTQAQRGFSRARPPKTSGGASFSQIGGPFPKISRASGHPLEAPSATPTIQAEFQRTGAAA